MVLSVKDENKANKVIDFTSDQKLYLDLSSIGIIPNNDFVDYEKTKLSNCRIYTRFFPAVACDISTTDPSITLNATLSEIKIQKPF